MKHDEIDDDVGAHVVATFVVGCGIVAASLNLTDQLTIALRTFSTLLNYVLS